MKLIKTTHLLCTISLRGQKIRLRMHLEKASVYGLAFE
jgi:hypothetical protein